MPAPARDVPRLRFERAVATIGAPARAGDRARLEIDAAQAQDSVDRCSPEGPRPRQRVDRAPLAAEPPLEARDAGRLRGALLDVQAAEVVELEAPALEQPDVLPVQVAIRPPDQVPRAAVPGFGPDRPGVQHVSPAAGGDVRVPDQDLAARVERPREDQLASFGERVQPRP